MLNAILILYGELLVVLIGQIYTLVGLTNLNIVPLNVSFLVIVYIDCFGIVQTPSIGSCATSFSPPISSSKHLTST